MMNIELEALRKSPLCGEGAYRDTTTLSFEFDQITVVVHSVPAIFCPATGEHLIPGPIGLALDEFVHKTAETVRLLVEESGTDLSDTPVETQVVFPPSNQALTAT